MNESGLRTAVTIDFDELRQSGMTSRDVIQYLGNDEDLEDIIDVELRRTEPSEDWESVKRRLKEEHKLSADVSNLH